jgi:hypothetical protein
MYVGCELLYQDLHGKNLYISNTMKTTTNCTGRAPWGLYRGGTDCQANIGENKICNIPSYLLFLDSEQACAKLYGNKLWNIQYSFSLHDILIYVLKSTSYVMGVTMIN